jgi:hypothetical protein
LKLERKRLDRNDPAKGHRGKYGVVRLRRLDELGGDDRKAALSALLTLSHFGLLTYGEPGSPDEFFVLMLKDRFAGSALVAYETAYRLIAGDDEYADDICALALRAGPKNPLCKIPD